MRLWALLIFTASQTILFSQDIKPQERLILNDSLVFMGIDFSTAKFYNPDKTDKSIYIRDRHGPVWGQIDDIIARRNDLKYDFQKKFVRPMTFLFDSSYQELDSTWVIDGDYKGMSDDEVSAHIRKCPEVATQGLGIVILIDQMDMKKKEVDICAVYVDLKNNKVIKIIRATGGIGGGFGYTAYWNTGVENAYHDFITKDDKYLKELKKFFK
jgi:hypothetical protein